MSTIAMHIAFNRYYILITKTWPILKKAKVNDNTTNALPIKNTPSSMHGLNKSDENFINMFLNYIFGSKQSDKKDERIERFASNVAAYSIAMINQNSCHQFGVVRARCAFSPFPFISFWNFKKKIQDEIIKYTAIWHIS